VTQKERQPVRTRRTGPIRGRFLITDTALAAGERLLPTYRGSDGDHEGIVFLAGFETQRATVFTGVLAPQADHGPGRVLSSQEQVLTASRAARSAGMSILAQLHSHPGAWTRHSEGDDSMVFMPFEGMLSIVAPWYGRFGLRPLDSLGVHQYQEGSWVLCDRESVRAAFRMLPTELDLR
jgi:proteasome lid subunit RPN8/RPN11